MSLDMSAMSGTLSAGVGKSCHCVPKIVLLLVMWTYAAFAIELELVLRRDAPVLLVLLGRRRDAHGADRLGLLVGLLRPGAGEHVVGALALRQEVHRHHRELLARAALEQEHVVARRGRRASSRRSAIASLWTAS